MIQKQKKQRIKTPKKTQNNKKKVKEKNFK